MRTKILDLEAFRELIDKKDVEETPTHFRMLHNLGGGEFLELLSPKVVVMAGPNDPANPFSTASDLYGHLATQLGAPYADPSYILGVTLGIYHPAGELSESESFELSGFDPSEATHAMLHVEWALGNPPPAPQLDSEFAQRVRAVYCHRADQADPESDYSPAHGTDVWILPIEQLGAQSYGYLLDNWRKLLAISELSFKKYEMEAPFFRERLHELDDMIGGFGLQLNYGDEYAVLVSKRDPETEMMRVYYDAQNLKALREAAHDFADSIGGMAAVMGTLFSGLF